ncbi:MAG: hypothetical protein Kow0037_11980 [Calditrichia bacterium]
MKYENTVIIISNNPEFRKKYHHILEGFDIIIKESPVPENRKPFLIDTQCDFYIADNTDNNFPFSQFCDFLTQQQSASFLISIGNPPPADFNSSYMIFTANEKNSLYLEDFLRNTVSVLQNSKAQIELASLLLHDARSPLNSLIGYLELLLNDTFGMLNEGQRNILEKAMTLGDSTLDMLEDISEIFKGKQSNLLIQKRPFDLCKVIEDVLLGAWVKADQKNIQIHKKIGKELPPFFGDDYQIQRVLNNLITNSIKYSPQNSTILLETSQDSSQFYQVTVADNGGGVPDELLPYLFHKNFRAHQPKAAQRGYGLGLYICKIIVKAHSGKIWAENNTFGGLSVHFTLPVYEETEGS